MWPQVVVSGYLYHLRAPEPWTKVPLASVWEPGTEVLWAVLSARGDGGGGGGGDDGRRKHRGKGHGKSEAARTASAAREAAKEPAELGARARAAEAKWRASAEVTLARVVCVRCE